MVLFSSTDLHKNLKQKLCQFLPFQRFKEPYLKTVPSLLW